MEILITLLSLAMSLFVMLVTLLITLVASLIPVAIFGFVMWQVLNGKRSVMVSGPLVDALAATSVAAGAAAMPKLDLVMMNSCRTCGSPQAIPSRSAYVHCDYCGQLTDWDFKAAMADKRSKAPGPAYEALLARANKGLSDAKEAGNKEAYEAIQRELWTEYARACPAACPPRVVEEGYRKRWIDWTAKSQTLQDFDAGCAATLAAQTEATNALQWDRSNPFQPKAEKESFDALTEAVLAHQQQVVDTLRREELLEAHPDRPHHDLFRRIGTAAFVQGWLPFLPEDQHEGLLRRTELHTQYIKPIKVDMTSGTCPSCAAPLEVPADAWRVVCMACGNGVSVVGGKLPCLGCGADVEIPEDADDVACTYCDTHVRRIGIG